MQQALNSLVTVPDDHARLATVSEADGGAVALSLVSTGTLRFGDTIGRLLPWLPRAWHRVTLRELLQHRSGLPDYRPDSSDSLVAVMVAEAVTGRSYGALLRTLADRPNR